MHAALRAGVGQPAVARPVGSCPGRRTPWCHRPSCTATTDLTLDHATGLVLCNAHNADHRGTHTAAATAIGTAAGTATATPRRRPRIAAI
jgi:hypothetical protein